MTAEDQDAGIIHPSAVPPGDLAGLRAAVRGPVIGPDDAAYDQARAVWNAAVDRRPLAVARCLDAADVSAAISFAVAEGLEIAVRCGAHSMGGASAVDDGLVIDLRQLDQVTVDPVAKRARVGGGALLADVDLAAQAHGLALPAGLVSHTGVGGLTLGGGMGWLTRRAGLTIDNLVSAEVVTADGRVLRASEDEHADLFWGIRGGGGNFGVVTEFEFDLHEVDPVVQFGLLFWPLEQGPQVLRLAREVIGTMSRDLNIIIAGLHAPPAPFVPEEHRLQPGYALLVTGFGATDEHNRLVEHLGQALPPSFEFTSPMPYVALQQMLDEGNAWGSYCYDKGTYLEDLSDEAIEVISAQLPRKTSPASVLLLYRLDGAYSEVAEDHTAFGGRRTPRFAVFMIGVSPAPELLEAERAWVRSFWDALQPHASGVGSYVNAMSDHEARRVEASYGPDKYMRLAHIKGAYDPTNLFHRNANIVPA